MTISNCDKFPLKVMTENNNGRSIGTRSRVPVNTFQIFTKNVNIEMRIISEGLDLISSLIYEHNKPVHGHLNVQKLPPTHTHSAGC